MIAAGRKLRVDPHVYLAKADHDTEIANAEQVRGDMPDMWVCQGAMDKLLKLVNLILPGRVQSPYC